MAEPHFQIRCVLRQRRKSLRVAEQAAQWCFRKDFGSRRHPIDLLDFRIPLDELLHHSFGILVSDARANPHYRLAHVHAVEQAYTWFPEVHFARMDPTNNLSRRRQCYFARAEDFQTLRRRLENYIVEVRHEFHGCLLYTSDAADER